MTEKTPELRLAWSRTWPDEADDYTGREAGAGGGCRIYRYLGGGRDEWRWVANGARLAIAAGMEPTARDAALAAERAYWASPRR